MVTRISRPLRLALCDDSRRDAWSDGGHRFARLARPIEALGHRAILLDARSCGSEPILTAFGRERDGLPLVASTRIARAILGIPVDICLFPANAGLAHATLMARACGEISSQTRVLLWDGTPGPDEPSTRDWPGVGLAALTERAMARFCAAHADGIFTSAFEEDGATPSESGPPFARVEMADFDASFILSAPGSTIRRMVFIGPLTRAGGLGAFVDVLEAMARDGAMRMRDALFIGSFDEPHAGIDREWFGRRAGSWPFRFRVKETRSLATAATVGIGPACLTLVAGTGRRLAAAVPAGLDARWTPIPRRDRFEPLRLRAALQSAEQPGLGGAEDPRDEKELAARLVDLGPAPDAPAPTADQGMVGLSVCILHHDRPHLLEQAVASVLDQITGESPVEIIVLDNASTTDAARSSLDHLATRPGVAVIRLEDPVPYSSALNRAADHATQPFLVFLDDDNLLTPHGLRRIARACAAGSFDVLTSTLDLFDDEGGASVGTLAFIGPAWTSGLFANTFGDNCMAFRRESFRAIGGYLQKDCAYPSADWILLCRAQAAGLAIGVLQQPAFRYRRNLRKSDGHWQRYDQQLVRAMVLQHYGSYFDPGDVAQVAQAMLVELAG